MRCSCGGLLSSAQKFQTDIGAVTRKQLCKSCGKVYTSVEILVEGSPEYGKGAEALARKLTVEELRVLIDGLDKAHNRDLRRASVDRPVDDQGAA